MKKMILSLAALLVVTSLSAQHTSFGLRTGFSKWKDLGNGRYSSSGSWDKEVFARFNAGSKFMIDAAVGFYGLDLNGKKISNNSYPEYFDTGINEHTQNIELSLSVQYDVSCEFMRSTPCLKKLKSYVGVMISPTLTRNTAELQYREAGDDEFRTTLSTKDALAFWTGINHSFVYQFSENFYTITMAKLEIDPYRLFEKNVGVSTSPDSRFGLQIGVGYLIN